MAEVKLTAFQQEQMKAIKKIMGYKLITESNIVSILFKEPDSIFNYDLKLEDFHENCWKVYFFILETLIIKEKKIPDDITISLFLEKHEKLRKQYEEYGGFNTLINSGEYVKVENLDGYVTELYKWMAVLGLVKRGFPVYDKLSEFVDMSAEEIYDYYDSQLNHNFVNIGTENKSYNIADDIDELIEELDEGLAVGMPYYNLPQLTKETGGRLEGNITLIGALSNKGKTSFTRNTILPTHIDLTEPIVILLNEDGRKKWMRELLVFVVNNVLKKDIQKYIVRDGKYPKEIKDTLKEAAQWIKKQKEDKIITLIPLKSWSTKEAIKHIKKFCGLGVKHFIIDTYKNDADAPADAGYSNMMANMVRLYDVIKPDVKNVHLTATFQLEKGKTSRQRYYSQDNVGISKNMIDPCSTVLMFRDLFDDEYADEKNEVKCYKIVGASKVPIKLQKGKRYQLIFIVKNREGSAGEFCVVVEHDLSRNTIKEIGLCTVNVDF
jgi:replicative DNA helicase